MTLPLPGVPLDDQNVQQKFDALAIAVTTLQQSSVQFQPGDLKISGDASPAGGWLPCDGSAVSRTTYSALFNALGTVFGVGDGVTTFNVPDMRQRFPLGKAAAGTGSTLGGTGGAIDHAYTAALPNHVHTDSHTHTYSGTTAANDVNVTNVTTSGATSVTLNGHHHDYSGTTSDASADTGNPTSNPTITTDVSNPPYLAVNYFVKT